MMSSLKKVCLSLSTHVNLVPTVWLLIDAQSGSIPLECLSGEVD